MGPWLFVRPRFRELVEQTFPIRYIGRPEASSPAEGSLDKHNHMQASIVAEAFANVPALGDVSGGNGNGTVRKNGTSRKTSAKAVAGE